MIKSESGERPVIHGDRLARSPNLYHGEAVMEHTAATGYRYTLSMRVSGETIEPPEKFNSVDDAIEYGRTTGLTHRDEITLTDHSDNPYTVRFTTTGFTVRISPAC
jgi:hypothetical protein